MAGLIPNKKSSDRRGQAATLETLKALLRAVKILNGQSALARGLGISQGHVWSWINRDKRASASYAIDIEHLTQGEVTRYELRPDVFRKPLSKSQIKRLAIQQSKPPHPLRRKTDKPPQGRRKRRAEAWMVIQNFQEPREEQLMNLLRNVIPAHAADLDLTCEELDPGFFVISRDGTQVAIISLKLVANDTYRWNELSPWKPGQEKTGNTSLRSYGKRAW
jgi:DNA-binding transcriptional regulator YdaS (Cro superfamily)